MKQLSCVETVDRCAVNFLKELEGSENHRMPARLNFRNAGEVNRHERKPELSKCWP